MAQRLMSARDIAAGVRHGELDPVDVVREHLSRIDQLDGALHAFTALREREALDDAAQLRHSRERSTLPLAGVPVAIKDNFDVAGLPTRYGSQATSPAPATRDAPLVQRLHDAGALIMGKTSMPELAIWPFTEGDGWATRNPIDTARTCGGSSGGSAVAVATGMAALAIGTDSGGSIRIPAACCGVVGVKPTPGVVPLPEHWYGLSVAGPFARDVDDAALMLGVLRGGTTAALASTSASSLRIAVSTRHPFPGARVDATASSAVQQSAHRLADARHHVAYADPPYPQIPTPFLRCYLGGIADDDDALFVDASKAERRTRAMARWGRWLRRLGPARRAQAYPAARHLRHWFDMWDVVITPALAYAPPLIGRWNKHGWLATAVGVSRWIGFSPLWNLAGCAAATVPVDRYRDGMPVAVQIVAAPGRERLLLAVAAQIETQSQWTQ